MLPVVYPIDGPWPGQLAIVPRPRGGEWLDDELQALKKLGFDLVVSLLTNQESEGLGISSEGQAAGKYGLEFQSFPIPDLGVPHSSIAARDFLGRLLEALRAGKKVAIHCRQGIGRSGLIAASLLVMAGVEPIVALRKASAARGLQVPETSEQHDWVIELAHDLELART